jgi:hypothetical protein
MRRTTLTAFVVGPPRRPLPLRPSPEPRSINRLVPPPVQRVGFNYPSIGGCDDQPAGKSGTAQPSRRFLLIMSGGNHASLGCCSHSHSRSGGRRLLRIRTGPACAAVALSRTEPGLPSKNRRLGSPPARSPPGSANLSDELSRSKGVICPPAGIDPGISVPPVGGGVTPVIPPPGTPGGDPGLVPK